VGGKSHYEINVFLQNTLGTTSFFQDNSSESIPNAGWVSKQEIRDFQIHRSMLVLLLFSSAHSFSIGFRSGTRMAIADAGFVLSGPF